MLHRRPAQLQRDVTAELVQGESRVVGVGDHPAVDDVDPGVAQKRLGLVLAQPAAVAAPRAPASRPRARPPRSPAAARGHRAGVRIAAAQRMPVRSPATAGTPDWANRQAAASSSNSGSVEATIVGAGLSRRARDDPVADRAPGLLDGAGQPGGLVVEHEHLADVGVLADRPDQAAQRVAVAPDHRRVVERVGDRRGARQQLAQAIARRRRSSGSSSPAARRLVGALRRVAARAGHDRQAVARPGRARRPPAPWRARAARARRPPRSRPPLRSAHGTRAGRRRARRCEPPRRARRRQSFRPSARRPARRPRAHAARPSHSRGPPSSSRYSATERRPSSAGQQLEVVGGAEAPPGCRWRSPCGSAGPGGSRAR